MNLALLQTHLTTQFLGRHLIYMTSTGSTQDVARAQAEEDCPEGTLVFAEEQTAGRGRLGRSWESPVGRNLYLTAVLRPGITRLKHLAMIAPLAVVRALEDAAGLRADLKWPNDVLLSGRKVSGVLIDNEFLAERPKYSLVGVGVNVNFDIDAASEIASIATSVKMELGQEASREEVLAALLNRFEELYERTPPDRLHSAWRERLSTLGRSVTVRSGDQIIEGVAEDVNVEGSLIVRRADGSACVVEAGEVTLRSPGQA